MGVIGAFISKRDTAEASCSAIAARPSHRVTLTIHGSEALAVKHQCYEINRCKIDTSRSPLQKKPMSSCPSAARPAVGGRQTLPATLTARGQRRRAAWQHSQVSQQQTCGSSAATAPGARCTALCLSTACQYKVPCLHLFVGDSLTSGCHPCSRAATGRTCLRRRRQRSSRRLNRGQQCRRRPGGADSRAGQEWQAAQGALEGQGERRSRPVACRPGACGWRF